MKSCETCSRRFLDDESTCPMDGTALQPAEGELPPEIGDVLGSYRLVSLIGEGGMGRIYAARHTKLKRYAAIKRLRRELGARPENIVRFFQEARMVNAIRHPNIVEVIDLVDDPEAGPYCVLELLDGISLREAVKRGPMPVDSVIRIGAQIADALSAVHALDIVHRDLKTENVILISRGGHDDYVKLIDFGIAQMGDSAVTGVPFGTAAYMAPEQATQQRVGGLADVYSLGVILYEIAVGRHPFPSRSETEYLLRHADEQPVPLRKVEGGEKIPRALEAVILRCMEKLPNRRYPSAAAVAVALRAMTGAPRRSSVRWLAISAAGLTATAGAVLAVRGFGGGTSEAAPKADVEHVVEQVVAPERTHVVIQFRSTPAGATAFRVGETVPLGVTPFELRVPSRPEPARIIFRLDQRQTTEQLVQMDRDGAVDVALPELERPVAQRAPAPPAPEKPAPTPVVKKRQPGRPAGPDPGRDGVFNPFSR